MLSLVDQQPSWSKPGLSLYLMNTIYRCPSVDRLGRNMNLPFQSLKNCFVRYISFVLWIYLIKVLFQIFSESIGSLLKFLSISKSLIRLFQKGPNYRLPSKIDFSKCRSNIGEKDCDRWCRKNVVGGAWPLQWKNKVLHIWWEHLTIPPY